MNNQNQIESKKYSLSFKSLIAWVVGLGTALVGITLVFSHFLSGVLVLIASSILIPPVYSLIKTKINLSLSKGARIFFYILFMVIGLTGLISSNDKPVVLSTVSDQKVVFDIPSLIGKDLKQLREVLGTPSYDKEPTALQSQNVDTWEKSWSKEGYSLMVSYNTRTKKVIDLFLGADSDATYVIFENTNNILKVGNLQSGSNEYLVEFVKVIKGNGYTGAIIKQKN